MYKYAWMYNGVRWNEAAKAYDYSNSELKTCMKIPADRADKHEEFMKQENAETEGRGF